MADTQARIEHARLSPRYWVKQVVIIVVVAALGLWGFYDGFVLYPRQAERFAQWAEWQYLDFLRNPPPGAVGANLGVASIQDPAETFERLDKPAYTRSPADVDDYRGNWLNALAVIGRLDPRYTTYPRENPQEGSVGSAFDRYEQLQAVWGEVDEALAPKRRSRFDILAQYPIFILGVGLAAYFTIGLVRAATTRYAWDPVAKRLTLPRGIEVAPHHVAEFDKSQWHKFYVLLRLTDDHPTHPGKTIKVDLYRHTPVEAWILEMERERFPDQAGQQGAGQGAGDASGKDAQGGQGPSEGSDGDQQDRSRGSADA
ncbi:MAG: hypothetical protein KatS3mg103_0242 [Phycisphaerales bacterium]|nr:MAG: hypothetical protein KatS3mg103_0242 [Phycisphaerales bacterium]